MEHEMCPQHIGIVKQLYVKQLLTQKLLRPGSENYATLDPRRHRLSNLAKNIILPWLCSDLLSNFLGQGAESWLWLSNSLGPGYEPGCLTIPIYCTSYVVLAKYQGNTKLISIRIKVIGSKKSFMHICA